MDGQKLLKWGLGLWMGYEVLKEINSNSQSVTNNINPVNSIPSSPAEYNTSYHSNKFLQFRQNSPTSPDFRYPIYFTHQNVRMFNKGTLLIIQQEV